MARKPVIILLSGDESWEHRTLSLTAHHGSLTFPISALRRGKLRLEQLYVLKEVIDGEIEAYHTEWAKVKADEANIK